MPEAPLYIESKAWERVERSCAAILQGRRIAANSAAPGTLVASLGGLFDVALPLRTDHGWTTLNPLPALAKWPRTAGLPMFDVMVAETLCKPTVENLTV